MASSPSFTRLRAKKLSPLLAARWEEYRHITGEALKRNLALAEALKPIAQRHGVSLGAIAVAWTLAWPGVTAAIVGARSPQQVDGWIAAAALELSGEDLDETAAAIARTGAGSGPVRPPK